MGKKTAHAMRRVTEVQNKMSSRVPSFRHVRHVGWDQTFVMALFLCLRQVRVS